MDEHIISINQQKENTVQFQVSIEGTDADDAIVRLVVDLNNGTLLMFPCVNIEGNSYEAKIPVLSHIERTAYPCYIEVITNGYYFKAMRGVVNVVGSATITAQPTTTFVKKTTEKEKEGSKEESETEEKTKEESLDVFSTKPTLPSLGVSGIRELADKAVTEAIRASKAAKKATEKKEVVTETVEEPGEVKKIEPEVVTNTKDGEKDVKVKQVLESMGITVKPKRQMPKLKIKRKV